MHNVSLKDEKQEKLPSGKWEMLKLTLETLGVIIFILLIETAVYHIEVLE